MFSYAGKVDIGVYEHQNDDRLLICSHILTDGEFSGKTDSDYIVASVCDGVGGLAQGYRAAMTTLVRMTLGMRVKYRIVEFDMFRVLRICRMD